MLAPARTAVLVAAAGATAAAPAAAAAAAAGGASGVSVPRCLRGWEPRLCPARRGAFRRGTGCAGAGGAGLGPGRRRGRGGRPSGAEAAAGDRPVPVRSRGGLGWAGLGAAVPGAGTRGVALGAGRAARPAPGSEGRDPALPGRRESALESRARVYLAAGLRPPRGGRESGRPEAGRDRPGDGGSRGEVRLSA